MIYLKVISAFILLSISASQASSINTQAEFKQHCKEGQNLDALEAVIKSGTFGINQILDGRTCLQVASWFGKVEVVKLLMSMPGLNINVTNGARMSSLALAATSGKGKGKVITELLTHPSIDVNNRDLAGNTCLNSGAGHENSEVLRALLTSSKINVNNANGYGWTPLISAVNSNRLENVKLLLSNPEVKTDPKNRDGETALDIARRKGFTSIVEFMTAPVDVSDVLSPNFGNGPFLFSKYQRVESANCSRSLYYRFFRSTYTEPRFTKKHYLRIKNEESSQSQKSLQIERSTNGLGIYKFKYENGITYFSDINTQEESLNVNGCNYILPRPERLNLTPELDTSIKSFNDAMTKVKEITLGSGEAYKVKFSNFEVAKNANHCTFNIAYECQGESCSSDVKKTNIQFNFQKGIGWSKPKEGNLELVVDTEGNSATTFNSENRAETNKVKSIFFESQEEAMKVRNAFNDVINKRCSDEYVNICDRGRIADAFYRTLDGWTCKKVVRSEFSKTTEIYKDFRYDRNLTKFPKFAENAFDGFINVKKVHILFHPFNKIPEGALDDLKSVEMMTFRGGNLQKISANTFSKLENVKELKFSLNRINKIGTGAFTNLEKLIKLDLEENKITKIDASAFSGLYSLEKLFLGENIEKIERGLFGDLISLKELTIVGTFTSIPDFLFGSMLNLEILGIHGEVESLSFKSMNGLLNLKRLNLNGNKLTELSNDLFTSSPNITNLQMQNNRISKIGDKTFKNLPNLTWLEIDENKLTKINSKVFSSLSKLTSLDLRKNNISKISRGAFSGMKSMEAFRLSNNDISSFPRNTFKGLNFLEYIYMENNPMRRFSRSKLGMRAEAYMFDVEEI
ncbi:hypothetical protein A9Q84_13765 [Halobacteriovorax marinus]|uniref:Uncharacterized protein n=1 Tax=Halobacteriovorax marinus TaxID=97084 RepID=A0A1Y5F8W2_9BACT|nr:hypothetical protein A9Q84_13765 [Halobacteriovorax marinus]